MALRLEDKKALVEEVNAVAGDSITAVAAEYRGLSVAEMTELRREARNSGVYLRVVKNTLAKRAIEGTEFEIEGDIIISAIGQMGDLGDGLEGLDHARHGAEQTEQW